MPLATEYSPSQDYAKYLKKKKDCGCGGKCDECNGGCNECDDKNCGCCPPGLVAVHDNEGNHVACLTPNDAELYNKNTFTCSEGFIKVYDQDGDFIGCLNAADYATYVATLPPQ